MANIYALKSPITNEVFYVGATTQSLSDRLKMHYQHLKECNRGERKTNRRYEYLNLLSPYKASIELLEEVEDVILDSKEKHYIDIFRKLNPLLTNMTDGGRGQHTSKYFTEEEMDVYSKKISKANKGRSKPLGFAENLSKARQGLGNPAVKDMCCGWLVVFKETVPIRMFKYGFEVNNFVGNKSAYANVYRRYDKGLPYGYKWTLFTDCTKDIQDIVQANYESSSQ
jgi:hypothetical protein